MLHTKTLNDILGNIIELTVVLRTEQIDIALDSILFKCHHIIP